MRKLFVALFGLLIMSAPAGAQDVPPVGINVGAGVLFPLSASKMPSTPVGTVGSARRSMCRRLRPSGGGHVQLDARAREDDSRSPAPGGQPRPSSSRAITTFIR